MIFPNEYFCKISTQTFPYMDNKVNIWSKDERRIVRGKEP